MLTLTILMPKGAMSDLVPAADDRSGGADAWVACGRGGGGGRPPPHI